MPFVEDNTIVDNVKKTEKIFNNFFSNIITNPGIPQYKGAEQLSLNKSDPCMNEIIKYRPIQA